MLNETQSNYESFEDYYQKAMENRYKDENLSQDLLNRSVEVDDICAVIRRKSVEKDYFSMAVSGVWGCGKSFVLSEIKKKLESEYIFIPYDCWENDFYDEPLYGILYSLVLFFNKEDNPDFAQSQYYKAMRRIIFGIVKNTPLMGDISRTVMLLGSGAVKRIQRANCAEVFNTNVDEFQKNVHSVLDQISAAIATYITFENKRVVITVDELDRCLPNYALKVLNRLHHICYGSSIILITAVNKEELLGCINTAYGKNSGDEFSKKYIDRFFDYTYNLSKGNASELVSLWKNLDDFDESIVSRNFLNNVCVSVLKNFSMREKKKLINTTFSLHKIVLEEIRCEDVLSFAVLCAELMFTVKFLYFDKCDWDFAVGPFEFGPVDSDNRDIFGNPKPIENVFTIELLKKDGNAQYVSEITLEELVSEYDTSAPHFNIPIDTDRERLKALFANPLVPYTNDPSLFICNSKDALFLKERKVFELFKKKLYQHH